MVNGSTTANSEENAYTVYEYIPIISECKSINFLCPVQLCIRMELLSEVVHSIIYWSIPA